MCIHTFIYIHIGSNETWYIYVYKYYICIYMYRYNICIHTYVYTYIYIHMNIYRLKRNTHFVVPEHQFRLTQGASHGQVPPTPPPNTHTTPAMHIKDSPVHEILTYSVNDQVMSHTWMSHVMRLGESCHTWMSDVTQMDEAHAHVPYIISSCHTYRWVMSLI